MSKEGIAFRLEIQKIVPTDTEETVSETTQEEIPEAASNPETLPEANANEGEEVQPVAENSGGDGDTDVSGNSGNFPLDLVPSEPSDIQGETGDTKEGEGAEDGIEEGKTAGAEGETGTGTVIVNPNGGDIKNGAPWEAVILLAVLFVVSAAFSIFLLLKKKKTPEAPEPMREAPLPQAAPVEKEAEMTKQVQEVPASPVIPETQRAANGICGAVGKVHNIGRRSGQQDSLGVASYRGGVLAVVADGMGGLSDGDKVSQKIVLTMMQDSASLVGGNTEGVLYQMVAHVNSEVNHMLGASDTYKSGSTLIAVLVEAGNFQWISVGDSRIYLYRGRQLLQINREHVYTMDLLQKAVNHEISFGEIGTNPQRNSVSSFIGMGDLKYIDGSMRPIRTQPGDRILLMSDGVFNTLPEQDICNVLSQESNAEKAARILEGQVLARQNPKQDNFTAIILDI